MNLSDISSILTWWIWLFVLTIIFFPLTVQFFSQFVDRGYIFTKTLSVIFLSYIIFVLGILHILPFTRTSLFVICICIPLVYIGLYSRKQKLSVLVTKTKKSIKPLLSIIILEEALFLIGLFFLSYIRSFSPDIHGLEKYMDYGFVNSIIRSTYFPPQDMWFPPLLINYYYFGHLVTAALTVLTGLQSNITYNLMLATIFALCFVSSFSLGANLLSFLQQSKTLFTKKILVTGILAALLVTLGGNLHTVYTLFTPYQNEKPVPPWELTFSPSSFPNSYWYPNATRYIYNTIHEFPIYSWTVADLHGHVLDIPFVLLTLALLFSFFQRMLYAKEKEKSYVFMGVEISHEYIFLILIGFLLAIMYMTNAWDGIIYFLLTALVIFYTGKKHFTHSRLPLRTSILHIIKNNKNYFLHTFYSIVFVGVSFLLFSQPFTRFFKPFVSGIGVLCTPDFLIKMEKFGPLLFEANHCQHSPWWQLLFLYGFFYFFVVSFLVFLYKHHRAKRSDFFVLLLILISTMLLIIPEFIYAKDIYPAHYRANTMFKLAFQAFMMLGISSAYIIVRTVSFIGGQFHQFSLQRKILALIYLLISAGFITLVLTYPYLAITSYYGDLKNYSGLDGTKYLQVQYPSDYEVITWMNENIKGQPIILEAQGDSYTDYARVSSNTGLPTVLGWTVHEWLWRGSYDVPSPRIGEVQTLYESRDLKVTRDLLDKYSVEYVFVGSLEREKYPSLYEDKFNVLGRVVHEKDTTKLYKIH